MDFCIEANCGEKSVESKGKFSSAAPSWVYCWKHLAARYAGYLKYQEAQRRYRIEIDAKMREMRNRKAR